MSKMKARSCLRISLARCIEAAFHTLPAVARHVHAENMVPWALDHITAAPPRNLELRRALLSAFATNLCESPSLVPNMMRLSGESSSCVCVYGPRWGSISRFRSWCVLSPAGGLRGSCAAALRSSLSCSALFLELVCALFRPLLCALLCLEHVPCPGKHLANLFGLPRLCAVKDVTRSPVLPHILCNDGKHNILFALDFSSVHLCANPCAQRHHRG